MNELNRRDASAAVNGKRRFELLYQKEADLLSASLTYNPHFTAK